MITVTIISKEGRIKAKEVCSHAFDKTTGIFHKGRPHVGIKGQWVRTCQKCGTTESHHKGPVLFGWYTLNDKLRTFEIESFICICKRLVKANEPFHCNIANTCSANLEVGSQYKAEILSNNKVKILSQ